jgi:hypothetical protein
MAREYRLRHATVEALQWHGHSEVGGFEDNTHEILAFAAGHVVSVSDMAIRFSADLSVRVLLHGDWAIKNPHTGMIYALTDEDFHRTYITETEPPEEPHG